MYGWLLCPRTGRVLVQDDDGTFNLPGGTPEAWDADLTATLVREAFEENQVRVGETAYLGYQEVHRPGRATYAQARMAGVVEAFAERAPDPDGGRVYRRLMTSLEAAPGVLGWGEPAVLQAQGGGASRADTLAPAGQLATGSGLRGLTGVGCPRCRIRKVLSAGHGAPVILRRMAPTWSGDRAAGLSASLSSPTMTTAPSRLNCAAERARDAAWRPG